MEAKIRLFLIILASTTELSLCNILNTFQFSLFELNNLKTLKYNQNFDGEYLLQSTESSKPFNLFKCLSLCTKNELTKAITYEVYNNSENVICKSYSDFSVEPNDTEIINSSQSVIFIRKEYLKNFGCKYLI